MKRVSLNSKTTFNGSCFVIIFTLSLLLVSFCWSNVPSKENFPGCPHAKIPPSSTAISSPILDAVGIPQSEWDAQFVPPPVEPPECTPRPEIPFLMSSSQPPGDPNLRIECVPDPGTGLDESKLISANAFNPKISRGENWHSYCVVQVLADATHPYDYLKIFKNTGDPAATSWSLTLTVAHPSFPLLDADIEVVSSDDRAYVLYSCGQNVHCVWFKLSAPSNNGVSIVKDLPLAYTAFSLTSDEVDYNTRVYLYACWKEGEAIKFKRSLDQGINWQNEATVVASEVGFLTTGNAIAYCPGNDCVFINYTDVFDSVKIAKCSEHWGLGTWSSTQVMYVPDGVFSCGITSMYNDYLLATAHGLIDWASACDMLYVYSSDAGLTWSSMYRFNWPGCQHLPYCASNTSGIFSLLYYTYPASGECIESAKTSYANLGSSASWAYQTVAGPSLFPTPGNACLEEGSYPDHGGVWYGFGGASVDSYFSWAGPNLSVSAYPISPLPPNFGPSGGTLTYRLYVANNTSTSQTFQIWCTATKPNGQQTPPKYGPNTLTVAAGATYTTSDLLQGILSSFPIGTYYWNAYIGTYPSTILDSDNFPVIKTSAGEGDKITAEQSDFNLGSLSTPSPIDQPADFRLVTISPNPFNPTTVLSYKLPSASHVNLSVYDVTGRLVASVVDGWCEAGNYEVRFNGSELVSGVYFYRLQAGGFSANGKMVLLK